MVNKSVAIIGAGASGLITAIFLARQNIQVTLYEQNNKIGKKLLTTGNGRCNITNIDLSKKYFHCENKQFPIDVLNSFSYEDCKQFFNSIGLEFIIGQRSRVYPLSLQASSVVDLLAHEIEALGVNLLLNTQIKSVKFQNNNYCLNDTTDKFTHLVISTGNKAMPKFGSSESGFSISKQFGHCLTTQYPSLVQLVSSNKNLDMISGVKIDGFVNGIQGDILFTKYGLSGSAILEISRDISKSLVSKKSITISIDTMPNFTSSELYEILIKNVSKYNNKDITTWLNGFMNKKLAKYILQSVQFKSNIKYVKFLSKEDILYLVKQIKNLKFDIIDTKGFESSEVCAGGIDTKDINQITLESQLQKNLYFTGEVIDVDGDCGGYNLQWAWSSGFAVAQAILNTIKIRKLSEKNIINHNSINIL